MKLAITHDWLTVPGGAEKVVKRWFDLYPDAPVYTTVFDKGRIGHIFDSSRVVPSFMQKVPFSKKHYTKMLSLMPRAFEEFDLSEYDVVLSSSSSCAKGVLTTPDSVHIAYVHSPMRYAWDLYHEYYASSGALARMMMRRTMPAIRQWDMLSSQRVDHFIANSNFVARRIRKYYRREADVIFPPVNTEFYTPGDPGAAGEGDNYYMIISRFVPYKKIDLAIEACNALKRRLVIIGGGPDEQRLRELAGPTIEFKGSLGDEEVRNYYRGCKAFLFPALEDFGITPVEAQACGRPVIALKKGGALDTVLPGKTGVFFDSQDVTSLTAAMEELEGMTWDSDFIRSHAEGFSNERFDREISAYVDEKWQARLKEIS
ncbi:MAG: glycosyltransferase [Spirochaetales bacterium]|nr:glycosyltransferase [Spirochaetales bacterium]